MDSPQPVQVGHLADIYCLLDSTFRGTPDTSTQQVRTDFPLFFAANNLRNRRVVSHQGQIVCHAGFWPRRLKLANVTLKTAVIVLVATHPDYRHRGHAAICMMNSTIWESSGQESLVFMSHSVGKLRDLLDAI